jgi:hypothetical protein
MKEDKLKHEIQSLGEFIKAYESANNRSGIKYNIRRPVEKHNKNAPDFYIEGHNLLVEIKRVMDRAALETNISWSKEINGLQSAMNHQIPSWLKGTYYINTPALLKGIRGKQTTVVNILLDAIKMNNNSIVIEGVGKFEIKKLRNDGNSIGFILMGEGGIIDSPGVIINNILTNLDKANLQLGIKQYGNIEKRILLLVNQYIFASYPSEFIRALLRIYNNLATYNNIDEIWLHQAAADNNIIVYKIYDRLFLDRFNKGYIDDQDILMFQEWFFPLAELGDSEKELLFKCLNNTLGNRNAHELFLEKPARMEMVKLAEWLMDKNRYDDSIWLMDRFINDPDPQEPQYYSGDPIYNYHALILKGEDPGIITTVLGHLAWAVQKLTGKPDYMEKAFEYTKQLMSHNNLYIKLMTLYPITGICANRAYIKKYKPELYEKVNPWIHNIAFELIDKIKDNNKLTAIARALCRVFSYYKDISADEAINVLETLKITTDSASLFVYFGVFRIKHFTDSEMNFDGTKIRSYFLDTLEDDNPILRDLQGSITWQIWKILEDNKNEFDTLKEYIDMLSRKPYWPSVVHNIEFIINDWINDKPDYCIQWFQNILDSISVYSQSDKAKEYVLSVWTFHTEEIVNKIAELKPFELEPVVSRLIDLYKHGVYIGDIPTIFESYRLVRNIKIQFDTATKFRDLYNGLLKDGLKLRQIDWSDVLPNQSY